MLKLVRIFPHWSSGACPVRIDDRVDEFGDLRVQAWKERLAFIHVAAGQPLRLRINYRSELVFFRAFYEDIARWAADDPSRWAPWVAPCPVKAAECTQKKFTPDGGS
jgi:hypothetical protein